MTGMANDIFSLIRLQVHSSFMVSEIFIEHLLHARHRCLGRSGPLFNGHFDVIEV